MEQFECNGLLNVALHEGATVVKITHQQSHKSYISIDLPEKWHTFIKNNHRMGPAKVCR